MQRFTGADILKVSKMNYLNDPGCPTKKLVGNIITSDGENVCETHPLIFIGMMTNYVEPPFAVIKNFVSNCPTSG